MTYRTPSVKKWKIHGAISLTRIVGIRGIPQSQKIMAEKQKLIVIAGPNGAGKSTVIYAAREHLKARYGEVAAFELDDILCFIHKDWDAWGQEFGKARIDNMPYTKISLSNAAVLVNNFFNQNFKVVLLAGDILASKHLMTAFSDMIDNVIEIYHLILDPGDEVLIPRLTKRYQTNGADPRKIEMTLKHLQKTHDNMRAAIGPETLHLDNSKLSPEATLDLIMENTKNKSNDGSYRIHGSRKGWLFGNFLSLLRRG